MTESTVTVRLLFADEGEFHHEEVQVSAEALERHERLVDLIQEESTFLRTGYVDIRRLCSAQVVRE